MSNVRIPPVMRTVTANQKEVQAAGSTVGEVLNSLATDFPALREQLFDGAELRRFVNVYLNDQDVQYLQRLDTPVSDSDTVIILPAMAGGR